MSHLIGILLALVSIAVTTCKAMPDFHKQMSPQQLQSIFHVDTPEAVPHYEVVQLLHHNTHEPATQQYSQNYRRRKRSVEPLQQDLKESHNTHHVKKDLTKNPYYSELKAKSVKDLRSNSVYDTIKTIPHKKIEDIKEHKVSFNAFGKDLNLTLKQTQGLFKDGQVHRLPMWYVDNEMNATHGLNLQKIEDELNHSSDNIGQVFQDEENMAAILMRRHEVTGELVMEGSIGHDMVIKPLPHDLQTSPKESHHVIFKREADMSEHLSDFAFMEPDDLATSEKLEKLQNRHKRSAHRTTLEDIELEEEFLEAEDGVEENEFAPHKRAKRQAPYIIYPEILVIVDYDGYRLHGGDNLQVKRYFISFWNGVDLRYRLLKGPRIRISIAGIIISRGRDATPYLERNRVGRDAIDSAAALTDMGKYLFRERRLPVYDIAVAITKYDMCRRRKGGRCTKGTAGFAYVGGACVVNKRLEKVNSVAIIEDTGGFSGIIVAAHEVGHLLGAVHDGSPPPSYLGGPGAQRCRWEDGYIMSDLRHTERGFRWSPCTVQSFHHFLNGDTATCLHNAPHEDSALGRSLPGTLLSLDAQCRRDRGTYACFKDERVCAQLFCFDAQTGYCVAYRPAAEGSSCGNGLHCLDGRCTPLPSNVIPNYGNQYRLGYNNSLQIAATNGNNNGHDEPDNDNEDDDEEDTDNGNNEDNINNNNNNGGDDNDESNETIEKLKRKLSSLPLTTKTLQLQQQQQQQQKAQQQKPITTTAMPLTTTYIVTPTPRYGSKSTSSSTGRSSLVTPTFFENYFKKLQNHNTNSNSQQKPTITAAVENKTKLKISTKTNENKQLTLQQQPQHKNNHNIDHDDVDDDNDDGKEKSVNTFEAQFLKRTPENSSINEDNDNDAYSSNSSGSLNTNNSYLNTKKLKTTITRSSNTNNNNNNESLLLVTPAGIRTQTSLYVTNYIGDNTQQRLTTIRQQQLPQQQLEHLPQDTKTTAAMQQLNSHQQQSTPSPPPSPQQLTRSKNQQKQQQHESLYLITSTTRRPKIKTQKLIRRLRTQIK